MRTTSTCTVAEFRSTQVVLPEFMEHHLAGLSDDDLVDVTRTVTAIGSWVLAVRPHVPTGN